MLLFDAASISNTSIERPLSISRHISHSPQGEPSLRSRQLTAFARILAQVVLPVPREPVKRYAWLTLPFFSSFLSVVVMCS